MRRKPYKKAKKKKAEKKFYALLVKMFKKDEGEESDS